MLREEAGDKILLMMHYLFHKAQGKGSGIGEG